MTPRTEKLIDSRIGLNLAASLARVTPPWLGYSIARLAARWISARRDSELVKAVRSNQWVIAGEQLDREALDLATRAVFQNSARSIYDLYHYLRDPAGAERLFVFEPSVQMLIGRPEFGERGLLVAGLHMSGFDLALQWLCMNWIRPLALTIPNPEGGRRLEFEMRKKTGLNLVPASVSGLRQAIRHLKRGGVVVTGIDRPQPDYQPRPRFFGRPACLPTHHTYLALKAQTPVMVVAVRLENDGKYHVFASPPLEMDSYPGRTEEVLLNAEKVLATAECFIQQAPQQWTISQPVWPEAVNQIPR